MRLKVSQPASTTRTELDAVCRAAKLRIQQVTRALFLAARNTRVRSRSSQLPKNVKYVKMTQRIKAESLSPCSSRSVKSLASIRGSQGESSDNPSMAPERDEFEENSPEGEVRKTRGVDPAATPLHLFSLMRSSTVPSRCLGHGATSPQTALVIGRLRHPMPSLKVGWIQGSRRH